MTDALAKVARGIGMYQAPFEDDPDQFAFWHDPDSRCCDEIDDDDPNGLRTYLLTGDRPIRIMEKWGICLNPIYSVRKQQIVRWVTNLLMGPDTIHEAPTPAEAILACAMGVA